MADGMIDDEIVWGWQAPEDETWARYLASHPNAPPLPPEHVQTRFVGSCGEASFGEPSIFWRRILSVLNREGVTLSRKARILDIGVGWGRIYRWMMRDVDTSGIIGVDVDPDAIRMCLEAMPRGRFELTAEEPPETGMDLAVAYSVFSHLSEAAARKLLDYAWRALRPGGYLALTTMTKNHVWVWREYLDTDPNGRAPLLREMGFTPEAWMDKATGGQALYLPTGGGNDVLAASDYGEMILPRVWFATVDGFELVDYSDRRDLPQATAVLRRV